LRQLPVDKIKIDGSFVAGVGRDPDSEAIVRAVIRLGRSLGLRVVAEGVGTNVQCAFLRAEGCQAAQASTSPDSCRRAISRLYSGKIAARFIDFKRCCSRTARGSLANSIDALARGIRQVALSWTIPAQRPLPHTSGSVSASAAE
jgi:EAL domain-containing protein (putative c-di-GMP-specific phosphodiesterase class I)